MLTPDELHAAKLAIWHPGIHATEYVARQAETHELAVKEIRAYTRSLYGDPVIGLLRIARDMSGDATARLLTSAIELLDVSDPDDFSSAINSLRDAVEEYDATFGRDC